jgi:hypothetical protein
MTAVVDASVIIPARDAAATLGAQLDALDAQRYAGTFEVIVADNGSKDATAEIVTRRLRSTDALRLVSVDGEGVSRARNVGASYASGPTLLFCDADDVVGGSWCDGMTAALSSNDAVGGAIDFAELSPEHESDGRLLRGLDRWPGYEPFAWGCNFGIRTEVFHTVGGFDESFAGCDDEEMSDGAGSGADPQDVPVRHGRAEPVSPLPRARHAEWPSDGALAGSTREAGGSRRTASRRCGAARRASVLDWSLLRMHRRLDQAPHVVLGSPRG